MNARLTASPIPLHIEMKRLYPTEDRLVHELRFGIVGVDKPAVVIVSSECYDDPVITERRGRGVLELPDGLVDALAMKCFSLMSGQILTHDGDSGWWTLADVTPVIRHGFPHADAQQILNELSRHAQPGVIVRSTCLVADDDAI